MRLPYKTMERSLFADGYKRIIGVDEVGMGCLAGPVVVCAVSFQKNTPHIPNIRDSKLLSPKQRETLARKIIDSGVIFRISLCYPKTIDKLNIFQAARKAMARAVAKIQNVKSKTIVLVDGLCQIKQTALPQRAIIKGDRKVFAIACASVIAKVYRDRMMTRYAKRFPKYGFEKHKGYGTKYHVAMLYAHGPTEIHRRSFAPVKQMI